MEYIGKKISVLKKENELSIVILASPVKDKPKQRIFFAWLIAWTICGLFMIGQLLIAQDNHLKAYLFGWLGFWAYFEFKAGKAYFWRKGGVEKIKVRAETLFIKREIAGKGKIAAYRQEFISNFRVLYLENNFIKTINNSYWVVGGERLAFEYYGKTIRFGLQLNDSEAEKLFEILNGALISA